MNINWQKLFSMQYELDKRIMDEHQLTGTYFSERLLALQVEVGELANETRCFKYWSLKPPAERVVILEEYVDGIHFILSIGLSLHFENVIPNQCVIKNQDEEKLVEQFLNVNSCISKLREEKSSKAYEQLFAEYLRLGKLLGFNEADIQTAYFEKNKVNHMRQDEGY